MLPEKEEEEQGSGGISTR
ncbi:hypothetical protein ADUPG1_014289, partial [Aduncisulcus paluster]